MARNIPVGYACEPRVYMIRVSAYEIVDFEEINKLLARLCPSYQ